MLLLSLSCSSLVRLDLALVLFLSCVVFRPLSASSLSLSASSLSFSCLAFFFFPCPPRRCPFLLLFCSQLFTLSASLFFSTGSCSSFLVRLVFVLVRLVFVLFPSCFLPLFASPLSFSCLVLLCSYRVFPY